MRLLDYCDEAFFAIDSWLGENEFFTNDILLLCLRIFVFLNNAFVIAIKLDYLASSHLITIVFEGLQLSLLILLLALLFLVDDHLTLI